MKLKTLHDTIKEKYESGDYNNPTEVKQLKSNKEKQYEQMLGSTMSVTALFLILLCTEIPERYAWLEDILIFLTIANGLACIFSAVKLSQIKKYSKDQHQSAYLYFNSTIIFLGWYSGGNCNAANTD